MRTWKDSLKKYLRYFSFRTVFQIVLFIDTAQECVAFAFTLHRVQNLPMFILMIRRPILKQAKMFSKLLAISRHGPLNLLQL